MVDPIVGMKWLTKVLMDGGSDLNIMYTKMLDAMGIHYTTTPSLAMDGLMLKAATAIDNLTLKSYSNRLLQTL